VYNELAQLSREREWLSKEKRNWQERIRRIDARLREIAELQESLQQEVAVRKEADIDIRDAKQAAEGEKREVVVKY